MSFVLFMYSKFLFLLFDFNKLKVAWKDIFVFASWIFL
jgi:hypothetical protein